MLIEVGNDLLSRDNKHTAMLIEVRRNLFCNKRIELISERTSYLQL
jgi:hypothetical protein